LKGGIANESKYQIKFAHVWLDLFFFERIRNRCGVSERMSFPA